MNNFVGGLIGALVGGAVGAGIWAAIAAASGYEIGWIAWGVGFIVGLGAAMGSKGEGGPAMGVTAVVVSIAALLCGKIAAIELATGGDVSVLHTAIDQAMEDDEYVISYLADEIASSWEGLGRQLDWPIGDPDERAAQEHYPADVWQAADQQWNDMGADGQDDYRQSLIAQEHAGLEDAVGSFKKQAFKDSFSMFDLLFFGLAIVTAYKVGQSGGVEAD